MLCNNSYIITKIELVSFIIIITSITHGTIPRAKFRPKTCKIQVRGHSGHKIFISAMSLLLQRSAQHTSCFVDTLRYDPPGGHSVGGVDDVGKRNPAVCCKNA